MNKLWLLFLLLLPSRLKIEVLRLRGQQVSRKCYIGMSWLDVRHLILSDGASIGPFNVFKGLTCLDLGQQARIGRFNHFTASAHYAAAGGQQHGMVQLANGAVITMRHYFDCQSSIRIGEHSLIAGLGSIFFTHQKGIKALHEAKPIEFGPKVYLGTCCVVLPGATIAGYAYIVGGSLVSGALNQQYAIYSSPRAVAVKELDVDAAYFRESTPTSRFD